MQNMAFTSTFWILSYLPGGVFGMDVLMCSGVVRLGPDEARFRPWVVPKELK